MTTTVRPNVRRAMRAGEKETSATLPGIRLNPARAKLITEVANPPRTGQSYSPRFVIAPAATPAVRKMPSKLRKILCYIWIHRGEWSYIEKHRCDQIRHCTACEGVSTRQRHSYEWQSVSAKNCQQYKTCTTCLEMSGSRMRHEWSHWHGTGNLGTKESRECARCDRSESRAVSSDPTYY